MLLNKVETLNLVLAFVASYMRVVAGDVASENGVGSQVAANVSAQAQHVTLGKRRARVDDSTDQEAVDLRRSLIEEYLYWSSIHRDLYKEHDGPYRRIQVDGDAIDNPSVWSDLSHNYRTGDRWIGIVIRPSELVLYQLFHGLKAQLAPTGDLAIATRFTQPNTSFVWAVDSTNGEMYCLDWDWKLTTVNIPWPTYDDETIPPLPIPWVPRQYAIPSEHRNPISITTHSTWPDPHGLSVRFPLDTQVWLDRTPTGRSMSAWIEYNLGLSSRNDGVGMPEGHTPQWGEFLRYGRGVFAFSYRVRHVTSHPIRTAVQENGRAAYDAAERSLDEMRGDP